MISCVYCGGEHERPADVKQCWADHDGADAGREPSAESRHGDPDPRRTATRPAPARPPRIAVDRGDAADAVVARLRRGPGTLGRHVIVAPGAPAPDDWAGVDRVTIDDATLDAPGATIDRLRSGPAVIELVSDFEARPMPVEPRSPFEIGAGFAFAIEHLHHLVWANAIDARRPDAPRWTLVDRAVALGATVGGEADVVLPDGTEAWLDGGEPRHHVPVDGCPVVHRVAIEHGRLATPGGNAPVDDLAPDQLAAVSHPTGTARIIAPAGSGKTRVLTARARHLVTAWHVPPSAVCLVAFNKRAQEEMRERTADVAGMQVRTLNSIALAIVNGSPPFASQPRSWRTIDEPDVRRLLGRFVSVPRRRNTDPMAPWIEALSLVRLGLVDPVEVEGRYGGDVDGLVQVVPQYLAALEREGAVDFDGQIDRAVRVLLTDPAARAAARHACRLLLVDEFQDLTPAHVLLVRLLAGPGGSVFGVGDDDQTIYGYNGADPGWLIDFADWFPGAGDHPLEINYRCPPGVVEVADRLLRHNRRRVAKTIRAAAPDPSVVGWSVVGPDDTDTVAATVTAVRAALDGGAGGGDVAVLTRVNAVLAPVQVALADAGVPIAGGVGGEFLDRTAVRAAAAWLRLASGRPFAPDDLNEALRRPSRSLHPRIAEWVGEQRDVPALLRLAERLTNERDADRLTEFAGDIARLQALLERAVTTARVVDALIDDIGLGGAVSTLDDQRHGMNRGSQGDDLLAVRQLAAMQPNPALFEGWLRERLMVRRSADGVTLATVHRVKGQEWPHVVIHHAGADQFPHRLADDHEEERRLFHVALTRASHHVTVVAARPPSPFVAELTTEPPDPSTLPPEPATPPARRTAARSTSSTSDHPLLDRGRVLAVEGTVLVDQGHEWTIFELEPEAAVARRGEATRRFRIGSKVETRGRQRGELVARPGDVAAESALVFDLLREFRDRARDGKPAYTVFDDKTLAGIATRLPGSLAELSKVKGVGPAKLEQYGDAVLAVVDDVRNGT